MAFMDRQVKLRSPAKKLHVRNLSRRRLEFIDHNSLLKAVLLTKLHTALDTDMIRFIHIKTRVSQAVGHLSVVSQK